MKKLSLDEITDSVGRGDKLNTDPGQVYETLEDQAYLRRNGGPEEQMERAILDGVRETVVEPLIKKKD